MIEAMRNLHGVKAFFTTREGGVSSGKYHSLNVGFHVGDDVLDVEKNHKIIQNHFSDHAEIFYMDQVHSNSVCQLGSLKEIPSCDSLLTDRKKRILMVMVADCIPLLFFDAQNRVIAAIHAGRSGTFLNIVQESLDAMQNSYSCDPKSIYVSIGPHIYDCCYEVGQEVVDQAKALGYEAAVSLRANRAYLNMQKIIIQQLLDGGIVSEHIECIDACTSCNTDQFFSYRKEGETGRFCGVIMLE